MKVSKIDHTRTAVMNIEEDKNGILYKNPSEKINPQKNIRQHIVKANEKAQRLYRSAFGPIEVFKNSNAKFAERDITDIFNNAFIKYGVASGKFFSKSNIVFSIKKSIELKSRKSKESGRRFGFYNIDDLDIFVDTIVSIRLRKNLRKKINYRGQTIDIPREVAIVLKAIIKDSYDNLDENVLGGVYEAIRLDYTKEKQVEQIATSIEKQNTKVKIAEIDGKKRFVLSSFDNKKKHYIFDFMKEYAALSHDEKKEMMVHIRRLIILYVCGYGAYKRSFDSDIKDMSFGEMRPGYEESFGEEINIELIKISEERDKKKCKLLMSNLCKSLERYNAECYRNAALIEGISDADRFWLQFFEEKIATLFSKKRNINIRQLGKTYICEYLWNEWKSYIAMKFIDLGKAYYHFGTPDLYNLNNNEIYDLGYINPCYESGITSFDYEMVKAEETLDRGLTTQITYAIAIFSNALFKDEFKASIKKDSNGKNIDMSDVLQYKTEDILNGLVENAVSKYLQYFGGQSTFDENEINHFDSVRMVDATIDLFNVLRNNNFHYATKLAEAKEKSIKLTELLFTHEYSNCGKLFCKRYHSNNVPLFYKKNDILLFMNDLYSDRVEREAQIPSFNSIFKRKEIADFIKEFIYPQNLSEISTIDDALEKFRSSIYFILKEIYYYGFLKEKDLKERFIAAVGEIKLDIKTIKDERDLRKRTDAYRNFTYRLNEYISNENITFGEICQGIMTDYNMQNQIKEVSSKSADEEKFKHFKMLLHNVIKKAFISYLKEKTTYEFLKKPNYYKVEFDSFEEDFISPKIGLFNKISEYMKEDSSLHAWYLLSHFMTPKKLNMLQGEFKNYIQFASDIVNRANANGKNMNLDKDRIDHYSRVVLVLEFTMIHIGHISNELTDYFENKDDYALYLSKYIHFVNREGIADANALLAFCNTPIKEGNNTCVGMYCDEKNPIINRNVVISSMYGLDKIISGAFKDDRIELKEFEEYYNYKDKLIPVFNKGKCTTKEEQTDLLVFQKIKNRLELGNIAIYSEVLVDLLSELVSWSYLRERDLMYFQLGYYYTKLFHGNSIESDSFLRKIDGNDIHITDGAVLYQIIAMYAYDLLIYSSKGKAVSKKGLSSGQSVNLFCKHYCDESIGEAVYMDGLMLFEFVGQHDYFVELRNKIDHMKYLATTEESILQLYSDIYCGFFDYDVKLKKSVTFILKNVLARYFVNADVKMNKIPNTNTKTNYNRTAIAINKETCESAKFEYKDIKYVDIVKNRKSEKWLELPCRSEKFIKILLKMLEYKN